MRAFRATRDGYVAGLDTTERLVLAHVVGDTAELLQSTLGDGTATDPALRRLLPDASHDDADVASEFRRLTQDDLAAGKVRRLVALADRLLDDPAAQRAAQGGAGVGAGVGAVAADPGRPSDLLVPRDAARDTAAALTDVRLVLAERLGVTTDEDSEALFAAVEAAAQGADDDPEGSPDGTQRFLGAVFVTLGWLQESLVGAMLADLRRGPGRGRARA